MNKAFSEGVLM